MPKQSGILPIQGTMGNMTFMKKGKENLVREKTHVSPERFLSDPKFERVRENAAEFTRAARGAKLLRLILTDLLKNFSDKQTNSRLHSVMKQVLKGDPTHGRGLRTVQEGNFEFLEGFEFNEKKELKQTLNVGQTVTIDKVAGTMKLEIPSFIPRQKIVLAPGATHFRILTAAIEVNFDVGEFTADFVSSQGLLWSDTPTQPITLTGTVTPNALTPLIYVAGIEFYQEVNGLSYVFKGSDYHSLSVVKAQGI